MTEFLEFLKTYATPISLAIFSLVWYRYLPSYVAEKGKNLATKEDISKITNLVERAKLEPLALRDIDVRRHQLRYDACLESLRILDAYFSHIIVGPNPREPRPDKQYVNIEEARACLNGLLLTCSPEICSSFLDLIICPTEKEASWNPLKLLDQYRQLVRTELGFGNVPYHSDLDRTWLSKVVFSQPANTAGQRLDDNPKL